MNGETPSGPALSDSFAENLELDTPIGEIVEKSRVKNSKK